MSEVKLGQILIGENNRDAIHIAIAPVVASEPLRPGQRVGFVNDGSVIVGQSRNPIGIIDPFLSADVQRGEQCWMFLLPNTITSLRHEWTHPAFVSSQLQPCHHAVESEVWLRELAAEIGSTYEALMRAIPTGRIHTGDNEMYGCRESEDVQRHYQNVTGVSVGAVYFSCAC